MQVQEAFRTLNRQVQKRTFPHHVIAKTLGIPNKERILKVAREKCEVTYECQPIRKLASFSTETLKTKRAWNDVQP
jgi:hypothetical protein